MLTLVTAEPEHSLEELPGRPWAVRRAAGPAGRPALEIYAADVFVDLLVLPADWPLAPHIVRGACSAAAWGILPAAGRGLLVQFRTGRVRTQACPAEPVAVGGVFWFAHAAGRFRHVLVTHGGGQERHGVRAARPC
jgi:hypothetical protein